jgi:hypothetical protein
MLPMNFTSVGLGDSTRFSGQLYGQNVQIKQGISIKLPSSNQKSIEKDLQGKNFKENFTNFPGNYFFAVQDSVAPASSGNNETPSQIGILWDASRSRKSADKGKWFIVTRY